MSNGLQPIEASTGLDLAAADRIHQPFQHCSSGYYVSGRRMIWLPHTRSLRFKLLVASVLVEVVLLGLLLANSQRLIEKNLVEQAVLRTEELNPLLSAALAGPLAERDRATLVDILKASQRKDGLSYLVLFDNAGKMIAASGWDVGKPLPVLDLDIAAENPDNIDRYDTQTPILLSGQQYGRLHYGLSTEFLSSAKQTLLQQSLLIAAVEVTLSVLLLGLIGAWLTRHLGQLAVASRQVAAGDFRAPLKIHFPTLISSAR